MEMRTAGESAILDQELSLVQVKPHERQLRHQELEFYGFFHFSMNTFTGREWGDGSESPSLFVPEFVDGDQWVEAVKAAGMKGVILTCKHHDGFCLWPSRYTDHTIAQSPYEEGKGDIVRVVSDACRRAGLAFGVYLSPWDRNHGAYGQGKAYDDYFVNQLTELLTNYGDVFCVWLDGACGEGPNGKVQEYDWERYFETVRKLQPQACLCVSGPDVRWCGNEAGDTRPEEWSVVPVRLRDAKLTQKLSQQSDDAAFREKKLSSMDLDLGSRRVLSGEQELCWYPAEVDVSIRPGWFYHPEEDDQVRSLENLLHIYDSSVGGNAMLLLNVPPMPSGRIHENDVKRLRELGDTIRNRQQVNLAEKAVLSSDVWEEGHEITAIQSGSEGAFYKAPDGIRQCTIHMEWEEPVEISLVVLQEEIRLSQRIEAFRLMDGDTGAVLYEGKTIGYKKHVTLPSVSTKCLEIAVLESRVCPTFRRIAVY